MKLIKKMQLLEIRSAREALQRGAGHGLPFLAPQQHSRHGEHGLASGVPGCAAPTAAPGRAVPRAGAAPAILGLLGSFVQPSWGWRDGGMGMEGWSDGDGAMQGGCNGAGSAATCSSSRLRSPRPGHPCPPLRLCCFVFKPVIVCRLFSFKMMFRSSPLKQSLSLPMGREYQRGFSLFLCFPLQAWCCFVHKLARLQINK